MEKEDSIEHISQLTMKLASILEEEKLTEGETMCVTISILLFCMNKWNAKGFKAMISDTQCMECNIVPYENEETLEIQ